MIRIVLDAHLIEKFHDLREPLELCDTSGRVLARAVPVVDISQCEPVSPAISDEELRRRATSNEKGLTTQELIAHLGNWMFQVEWRPPAVDELANYWISADAPTRAMLTAAAAEIDRKLSDNPHLVGELREPGQRVDFVYPLSYTFRVDGAAQMVMVLHVRVYQQRR